MEDKLRIVSALGRAEIEFSELQTNATKSGAEYLRVTLRDYGMSATAQVYVYQPEGGLPEFFAELAANARNWKSEQRWESIDGELRLMGVVGLSGDVELHVTLSAEPHPDSWVAQGLIHFEVEYLNHVASAVAEFLQARRDHSPLLLTIQAKSRE